MKKLNEICTILEDNERCVILKVKDNSRLNLIALGCFNGNEDMIRLAKDKDNTITVFTNDGESYSWGYCTMVTQSMKEKRTMIQTAISILK